MSVRIRFNAEPHHVLKVGDQEIWGGEEGDVSQKIADQLAAASWADITIMPPADAAADPKEKK